MPYIANVGGISMRRAPRPAPREKDVEDQLVATVANEHVFRLEAVGLGDELAKLLEQWDRDTG